MAGETLLITGATGLVGSNLCIKAAHAGYRVRAMVRNPIGTEPLKQPGIEVIIGDVTDRDSLLRAAKGATGILHCAAVLGGTWSKSTPEEFWAVNYHGVVNVMEAAKQRGVRRVVDVDTLAVMDWRTTITERSPLLPITPDNSPYVRSKRASVYESLHRAALGQDVVFVTPGGIYGPGPFTERALHPTCFNAMLLAGITGKLDRYVKFPLTWVYVADVVNIALAAFERGRIGERYLALGHAADICSLPDFCNRAAELAGSPHRVASVDPASGLEIGTMAQFASRKYPDPIMDSSATTLALDVPPTLMCEGLRHTVAWLRSQGKID